MTFYQVSQAKIEYLNKQTFSQPHHSIVFTSKLGCNVMDVEFNKAYRVTTSGIDILSFQLVRVQKNVFMDDVFIETASDLMTISVMGQFLVRMLMNG